MQPPRTGEDDFQVPINNPPRIAIEPGFLRPRFRGDAPRWFTALIFALFLGTILAGFFLSRWG
jgi:hypothetical protein